ncbi:AI-2E family transporter [Pseudomonas sp. F1_0610]|uniref:AI-2E family transporter n=1 Tax=Pseudomonas sp. F1_0610 TaxID=3114284 RepID=UPI0039C22965
MSRINNDRLVTQIILIILLIACIWVLKPFVSALFWAAVLAFATWPLMRVTTRLMRGNVTAAAFFLTGAWTLLVAIPLIYLGFNIADNIRDGLVMVRDFQVEGLPEAPSWLGKVPMLGERLVEVWNNVDQQGAAWLASVKPYLGQLGNWLLGRSATIARGLLEMALSLFLVFFFYRDGPKLAVLVRNLLQRLISEKADHYMNLIAGTVQRVVNGVIGTAIAQALIAWVGFKIVGAPGDLILAFMVFVLSLIPMGPPLVWGPVAVWLFVTGEVGYGVFMALWGLLVVSSVDNFLKPYLISRGGNLPIVVVLMGVFGGIIAFGFMGLFLGPTLLAVVYNLLSDWSAQTHKATQAEHSLEDV